MPVNSKLASATAFVTLLGQAAAFWRMECHSPIGLARLDPLVEPGRIADHAHTIHGGRNFGMTASTDNLLESSCTSCRVTQDFSVYWTPSLHFMYANGSTAVVPQTGGMLAYYLLYGENLQAFPKDFRMLAGDVRQRNFTWAVPDPPKPWSGDDASQLALSQKALGFNCLNYGGTPEATLYRHFMPDKAYIDANCANGIRMELMFPSCWNGKDLDSDDHKSHMAYPSMTIDGQCPPGFDTRVPSLLFETIWNTNAFNGVDGQFVLSNGDPTGYGYHGDFISGWDETLLQSAVDTCTNDSGKIEDCPVFNLQTEQEAAKCQMDMPPELEDDDCKGPRDGLPGNVPVQAGPEYASKLNPDGEPAPPAYTPPPSDAAPIVPSLGHSVGTRPVTDQYGGGITVAKVDEANAGPTPVPTEAAALPVDDGVDGKVIATSTYTSAGVVYEVVYEEVEVYTTVAPGAPAAHKHRRHHLHRRHNHQF